MTTAQFTGALHAARASQEFDDPAVPDRWTFSRAGLHDRRAVEQFIREGFQRAYSARLAMLMPTLATLRRDACIAAACGLRPAEDARLFLEVYLDQPIETVLGSATGLTIRRRHVLEVGNLVIARPGYARALITCLTEWLYACGPGRMVDWVVFSAVPALRNNFRRLGIPLVPLGEADGRRLTAAALADWGTYYDQAPQVIAVNVKSAYAAVRRRS